jgi:hypothetical protein
MTQPIRYCVTVDTEEEWDWDSGYPTGPARTTNIRQLPAFQSMCESAGSAVVYFTNHAVLANPESRAIMQEIATRPKVEIGLHIHPWNTPPIPTSPSRGEVSIRESFLHNLPWPEAKAKLDSTLSAFAEAGLKPTSYRGGRYSMSPHIQGYLREHSLWVDCSVLPFNTWKDDGTPDYRHRDGTPVRIPCEERNRGLTPPARPGAIWELPLSYGTTRKPFAFWLNFLNNPISKALRLTGICDRLGIVSRAWLNFENPHAGDVLGFLGVLRTMQVPFVSFTLHSSSLMVGGSPYAKTQADVNRTLKLAERVLKQDFVPATMTEIATYLESKHASTGNQPAR